jgi:hypothetical protein
MTTNKPVRPWDLFNAKKPKLSEEFQKERIEICLSCTELIKLTHQCKKCGCFIKAKTQLAEARCPIGKW